MNRILLTSSLAVSAAIIAAHEKGISNSEIYHVSNWLDQLDKARHLVSSPKDIHQKMHERGVEQKHTYNLVDSDLTRGQIAYCVTKHLQEKKVNRRTSAAITNKNITNKKKPNKVKIDLVKKPVTVKSSSKDAGNKKQVMFGGNLKLAFAAPFKVEAVKIFG